MTMVAKSIRYSGTPFKVQRGMMLRGNHKKSHLVLNSAALDKAIIKEIDNGWALPLIIESLQNIRNEGVVPLGVSEQFSINKKG